MSNTNFFYHPRPEQHGKKSITIKLDEIKKNLLKKKHEIFYISPTLKCSLDHIVKSKFDILKDSGLLAICLSLEQSMSVTHKMICNRFLPDQRGAGHVEAFQFLFNDHF